MVPVGILVFGHLSDKIGTSILASTVLPMNFIPWVFWDGNLEWLMNCHPRISIVDLS